MGTSAIETKMPGTGRITWHATAILGLLFLGIGAASALMVWLPAGFGSPEWEFATPPDFFSNFPLLGLGLALLIAHGVATGRKVQVRVLATACILIAVFMWLASTLFATTFPMPLRVVSDPSKLTPLKKLGARTLVQAAVYPFALLWLAGAGWKATLVRRR